MYYPEGMKARVSPVQSIEPHRILAPTRDLNQGPPGSESRVVTTILPLHIQLNTFIPLDIIRIPHHSLQNQAIHILYFPHWFHELHATWTDEWNRWEEQLEWTITPASFEQNYPAHYSVKTTRPWFSGTQWFQGKHLQSFVFQESRPPNTLDMRILNTVNRRGFQNCCGFHSPIHGR